MKKWQIQGAKSKFSKLVDDAISNGSQMVTRRGVDSVVVISKEQYSKLIKKETTLLEDLMSMPKASIDVKRKKNVNRKSEF